MGTYHAPDTLQIGLRCGLVNKSFQLKNVLQNVHKILGWMTFDVKKCVV